jgi:hypothetical protein
MASSDRFDGPPKGRRGAGADEAQNDPPAPVERGASGRIIVRSSSHPPTGEAAGSSDTSGARALPDGPGEARIKRDTPAERPRRRRQVESGVGGQRRTRDTAPALPTSLKRRSAEQAELAIEIEVVADDPGVGDSRFASGADALSSLPPVADGKRRLGRARALILAALLATAAAVALLLWFLLLD